MDKHVSTMAEKSERKRSKKRSKKLAKSSPDEQECTIVESADANASLNEKSASPMKSPISAAEEPKDSPKNAPKSKESNRQWSFEQEERLLKNIKKYSSSLSGKQQYSQRVNWSKVEQVEDFTQFEMQEKYKALTKKVRKTRSVLEIVEDAFAVHEEKPKKNTNTIKKKLKKQPPNAFSIFCKAKRETVKAKYPDLKLIEIHKKLCERWKELTDEKRGKYVSKAEKEKADFYEELKKMNDEMVSTIKKPMTAFEMWKAERKEDEDIEGDETENDFLVEWENLPRSTKKAWHQAATAKKEAYNLKVEQVTIGTKQEKKKDKKPVAETKLKEEQISDNQASSSDKKSKPKKAVAEVKTNDDGPSSDDNDHSSSSEDEKPTLKRKLNSSQQQGKSPATKVAKKGASSSESSESSSDED